ncbi:Lrp/AsnC family transcriptional regulator [Phenylobacterium sp.]|uniref:Lrp/AsnC family transcriptional regulator n=1 Tax=Phenylobacterium sp. TaxID=1871053 RepID=UPI0027311303|nr:Lrp/AsnC family transcriptional regulator [Phenylobacterium sp.]MDP1618307.1 Lrp/AsnC family transcriptional regulator [Phenylobacterium sp.]MDP1986099.1 Lrp/AsnC family transcriptional regulator [Phenylobacterium sp.]
MDETDRQLLALLRADARASVASLSERLKVSRGTVQNRIDRMRQRGVIQGFTVRTRPDVEAHRVRAVMTISVEGESSPRVVRALQGFAEVVAVHTTNGRWDLVAELDTDSLAAFSAALDEIRRIPGIAATETSILLATTRL